jgi:hypothetical protein
VTLAEQSVLVCYTTVYLRIVRIREEYERVSVAGTADTTGTSIHLAQVDPPIVEDKMHRGYKTYGKTGLGEVRVSRHLWIGYLKDTDA